MCSPDIGFAKDASAFANLLAVPVVIGNKQRPGHDEQARVLEVIGEVDGKNVLMVDDFTITGGTPIYKLERLLERDIDAPADVNSVGGLIIHRLERLPAEGETLSFDGFDLVVRSMQGARAKSILVHPKNTPKESQ